MVPLVLQDTGTLLQTHGKHDKGVTQIKEKASHVQYHHGGLLPPAVIFQQTTCVLKSDMVLHLKPTQEGCQRLRGGSGLAT